MKPRVAASVDTILSLNVKEIQKILVNFSKIKRDKCCIFAERQKWGG